MPLEPNPDELRHSGLAMFVGGVGSPVNVSGTFGSVRGSSISVAGSRMSVRRDPETATADLDKRVFGESLK
ncbi:MAG: hypothetical protein ABTD50_23650 [Polyangiaceae bacterium]